MKTHNSRVVELQQQQVRTNAATTSALALVRELGQKAREKDEIIAALRAELQDAVELDEGCDARLAPLGQVHRVAVEHGQDLEGSEEEED